MTAEEITERMRVLLDAAKALHYGEITHMQYATIVALAPTFTSGTGGVVAPNVTSP